MKWVMCNSGDGGPMRPKMYIGDVCLSVWGRKGEWSFTLTRLWSWDRYRLYQEGHFETQSEAKAAAENWFSKWIIEQFQQQGKKVQPEWYSN